MTFNLSSLLGFLRSITFFGRRTDAPPMYAARTVSQLRAQLRQLDFSLIYRERVNDNAERPHDIMLFWRSADGLLVHLSSLGENIGAASLHFCWRGTFTHAFKTLPQPDCVRYHAGEGETQYVSGSYRLDASCSNPSLGELIKVLQANGKLLKIWKVPHFIWITRDGRSNCSAELISKLGPGTRRALAGDLFRQFHNQLPSAEMV